MTYRMLPRMEMELDFEEGNRVYRVWCRTCKAIENYDSQGEAVDFLDSHSCPEEEYVDDE